MKNSLFVMLVLYVAQLHAAVPEAPVLSLSVNGATVDAAWSEIDNANGYTFFYAPYPDASIIYNADMGVATGISATLAEGLAFYVAVQAYNAEGHSDYSNIDFFVISDTSNSLPTGIVMREIAGSTFVMGNNQLKGPQAADATEHSVSLSDYSLSETEISHAQYVEFLNHAIREGLVEVITGSQGADNGLRLVSGTAASAYAGKVLYSLEGTRVMKDHDNADGDNNPFTGVIEPENPLNIAYIGYDSSQAPENNPFYVKDPHSVSDFHWLNLCNYYDYASTTHSRDTSVLKNDFVNWAELSGWTETNPDGAINLPTLAQVKNYPVTFIRWWGAQAFALYYGVKLPTEAQWEYAAKGGQDFLYAVHDGSDVNDANWNHDEQHPALHHPREVKSGHPNPFGLYNLGGNVWEWMADNYAAYSANAVTDPLVEISGSSTRAWRGGSWNYHQATLESAGRFFDEENRGNDHFGFRIAQ